MILVLRNDATAPAGLLGTVLDERRIRWHSVALDAGEPLPRLDGVAGLVALGGGMGAYEEARYPYLAGEKALLRQAVEQGIPVLGVCLGSQLLADALGGRAHRADVPEFRFAPVELTAAGRRDAVASTLAGRPVLRMHRDTWDPPPGAEVLAVGGGFRQVFRRGVALGVQPHPEVTPGVVASWLALPGDQDLARAAGVDPETVVAAMRADAAGVEATARAFFGAWLEEVEGLRGVAAS